MPGQRSILHMDMDAYFASLEAQACPSLKGLPLVVGAMPGSRGVVASASYEARAFGIRAGMPAAVARRLCPEAQFVPCHPGLYIDTSRRILRHLLSFTPQVEMFSIDEAFLEVTDRIGSTGNSPESPAWQKLEDLARETAASIEQAFGLSCSVGAGPNKLIAKMAANVKKPRGVMVMGEESFRRHFWPKPVDDLYGVGAKTASSLMIFGIETIGDLAQTPPDLLHRHFGVYGDALASMAWGRDDAPVVASHEAAPAKSLGHEHTVGRDLETLDEGLSLVLALSDRVGEDLRREGYAGRRIAIRIRYSDFSTLTRQRVIASPTQETREIFRVARDLFRENYCGGGVRLLGVAVGELIVMEGREQLKLFPEDRRYREWLEAMDTIRDLYGPRSILPAGAMRQPPRNQRSG